MESSTKKWTERVKQMARKYISIWINWVISDSIMSSIHEINCNHESISCLLTVFVFPWDSVDGVPITGDLGEKVDEIITVVKVALAHAILAGCPVLEELVLSDNWMNLKNIVISSSTLKSLKINDWEPFPPLYDPTSACKIKIDAANLTKFDYTGVLANEFLLNNVSSLVKACIHIPSEWPKEIACRVIDLLKQQRYVVSLKLSSCTLECLRFADKMPARFTVFSNLSHLTLTLKIGNYSFGALMDFLYVCPILQSICLSEGFKKCMHLGEKDPVLLSIPLCMSNCLKTLTFNKLHAYNSEICVLKYVLKYAHVLEKMDISCSKSWFPFLKDTSKVRKELETLQKSSTACVIKFS
ncbi:hypothetical protein L2E82_25980 [Cichorium intybus]|uniref:Uncharacterized protein n=1 Tax=Cichorium intybus TaxID=13427 RepID=A0ACB9E501_CICIN|nr:hypothetical protein L2E82_25980 [Cichorium intybus]